MEFCDARRAWPWKLAMFTRSSHRAARVVRFGTTLRRASKIPALILGRLDEPLATTVRILTGTGSSLAPARLPRTTPLGLADPSANLQ
jgi:hypothetical protein